MPATGAEKPNRDFTAMNKFSTFFLLTLFLLSVSCKDEKRNNLCVPDVFVDAYINTTLPQYQQLTVIGGWTYFSGGNRGLFVYHNASDEIVAFDRNCSYRPLDSCSIVSLNNSEAYLQCGSYVSGQWKACCNTKFNLDGFPYEGFAQCALRKYYVSQNGSVIRVSSSPF